MMTAAQAVPMPPVPLEPIYFEPPVEVATDEIYQQSCVQLDNAIRYLHPYRYSYKPEFHEDGANQIATTLIVFDSVPIVNGLLGLAYLGYSGLAEEKEQRRMLQVEQKVALLQQVKAEKHCFE
tara:strand:+ start:517760 stop:518128 length:369 start_codon:yes stop_codon:yes gene_type:complete